MNKSAIGAQGEWQDLLYVLVGGFYYAVHLRMIGNQISMFDLELLAKLLDHFSI